MPRLLKRMSEKKFRKKTAAKNCHERKTAALQKAKSSPTVASAEFDFWKNLSTPNISKIDVYYKRHLWSYNFNVHDLACNDAHLLSHDEIVRKKRIK
ncbi:voltage-dependent calcium channel unc-36 [Plakobranchus ocellatus]|uniref:Voltage-dependent calcium channel unc-36 n=1 Tax=Plakobranchus ocellatus TaxID=259542 RepID=A0AAV3Z927_9GAST|nr:voltage-dependent calcium channel unc-36 [Plakobranchus ocellatus]